MEILNWLQAWYKSQCNGNWEHSFGIKIETIDNPGWKISIGIEGTDLDSLLLEVIKYERSDKDWCHYWVKDNFFEGRGDPSKLEFLLQKFKEIAAKQTR